uniref:Uncharacterized protein n=1 Tax=Oryza nivara TaxID=4536 RepID=A0A0E0FFQ5_ORYNI
MCLWACRCAADIEHTKESKAAVAAVSWGDLKEYVEEMVAYCHADEYDYLRETCDSLRQFIADQRHHISQLSAQAEAKELQLQANYEALNQSKLGCADLKKKLECEKAWTRTIVSMMILFYVLLVAVMIRQLSKEYIRVQVTHGIEEIGGIEPPRSIPSIGNFAAHDDVAGELAIFRGTSTSWVVVAGAVSIAPVVVASAAPIAVEIAVGELGFCKQWGMGNGEQRWLSQTGIAGLYRLSQGHKRPYGNT